VWNEIELAQAMRDAAKLEPRACRARARERFSLARMIGDYFSIYERLTHFQQPAARVA
jgi:glycosyltransferase involved in cell wall biosynthesis